MSTSTSMKSSRFGACRFALVALAATNSSWALGPTAPFTPPRAAAPSLQAGSPTTGRWAPANATKGAPAAPAAAAPASDTALAEGALQGVRTGLQPVALLEGRWWNLGSGPGGRRITAIDSKGIWITLGAGAEDAKAPARQQRLLLLPNAAVASPTPTPTPPKPVLTASAHGAAP